MNPNTSTNTRQLINVANLCTKTPGRLFTCPTPYVGLELWDNLWALYAYLGRGSHSNTHTLLWRTSSVQRMTTVRNPNLLMRDVRYRYYGEPLGDRLPVPLLLRFATWSSHVIKDSCYGHKMARCLILYYSHLSADSVSWCRHICVHSLHACWNQIGPWRRHR